MEARSGPMSAQMTMRPSPCRSIQPRPHLVWMGREPARISLFGLTRVSSVVEGIKEAVDGRLLVFRDADLVDIHLTVQHGGGRKKFAIPAIVNRVDIKSIDV